MFLLRKIINVSLHSMVKIYWKSPISMGYFHIVSRMHYLLDRTKKKIYGEMRPRDSSDSWLLMLIFFFTLRLLSFSLILFEKPRHLSNGLEFLFYFPHDKPQSMLWLMRQHIKNWWNSIFDVKTLAVSSLITFCLIDLNSYNCSSCNEN